MRGRGNRKPSGNNVNRVFESTGPEGKVRGTPQQIIEKYLSLARDAQTADNRVIAENFFQHAEHYQRLLAEAMEVRQGQERRDNQQPNVEQPDAEQPDAEQSGVEQPEVERSADAEPESVGGNSASAGGGRQPREGKGQGNGRRAGRAPREPEVSGLTTIDSGQADSSSLLVDAEELSASQPRRRPRPRDREQTDTPADTEVAAEADSQTD